MRENTISFYNQESEQYSRKRYEGKTLTYFQFIFKRRQALFLNLVSKISSNIKNSSALEIGCADGVLIKKLFQEFPNTFSSITGVDVSPKMIEQAKETTRDDKARYFLRGDEPDDKYNLVIELGVHPHHFEEEMVFVSKKLNSSGFFIYSTSGKNSLHVKFKLKNKDYVSDYLSYRDYEKVIGKYFEIVSGEPYGLFVPKLWAFPSLARAIQPVVDTLLKNIFPELFHEKIYLLKKK